MNLPKLILLLCTFLLVSNCTEDRENFFVYNMDTTPIDSLFIFIGNKTYLIEDIQPKQEKGIMIPKIGGKKIQVQADQEIPLAVGTILRSHQTRGVIKIRIEKDRIVSSGAYKK